MCSFLLNNISNYRVIFFQDYLLGAVKNSLSKRVAIVALIALSCLATFFLVYQCCDWVSKEYKYEIPYSRVVEDPVEDLESDDVEFNSLEEEQELIKSLKQNWLDDPKEEAQRIKDEKLLSDRAQRRIDQLVKFNQSVDYLHSSDRDQISMVVGRVLELKSFYRKTHYVFTHGQAPEISIANQLIKEFVRAFTPLLNHPLKVPFRVPHTVIYSENADDFINKYNATENNSVYSDNAHNAEMISVDACLWNIHQTESALYFFELGSNINLCHGKPALLNIFKSIFLNYLPDETVSALLAEKACKIAAQKKIDVKVGTLYAICIPKAIVQDEKINFAYRCHPFGRKCNCFPVADRVKVLEEMQANKFLSCKTTGLMPQYRLLTSRLTEEKDVRSFAVDSLPKDKRKSYRNQIKGLVQEAIKYSHLCDLIEKLEEDPSVMDEINSLIESSSQLDPSYIQHLFTAKGLFYQ